MEKNSLIQIDRALINPAHIIWARHQAEGEVWVLMSGAPKPTTHKGEEAEALWRLLTTNCQVAVPEAPLK
jgi:hypothetical protein